MLEIKDQIAIVSGALPGVGHRVAGALHEAEARVCETDLSAIRLERNWTASGRSERTSSAEPAVTDEGAIRDLITAEFLANIPTGRAGRVAEAADLLGFLCTYRLPFSTGPVFNLSDGRATY